jgi:hypothetical protein
MGVTVGESGRNSTGDIVHGYFPDTQVVYTISTTQDSHLLNHYRDSISNGTIDTTNDFSKTLLLVDEVDSVVMCKDPILHWARCDRPGAATGDAVRAAFLQIQHPGAEYGLPPAGVNKKAWEIAKGAKLGWESFEKKTALRKVDEVEMLVALDFGKPDGLAHVALDYKNTIDGRAVMPKGEKSFIYVSSLPYLLTRYATIVGLSGSLGGESEKKYLET